MSAQPVNPWRMAISGWLDRLDQGAPALSFRDAWLRLKECSTADLELQPHALGVKDDWQLLDLRISSFGRPTGHFTCAVRDGRGSEERRLVLSAPRFSELTHPELVTATLMCLYRLAPAQSELEVVLEDKMDSPVSTLAVAGTYTDAGWGLNPERTELICEAPRLWVFRFSKN